MHDMIQTCSFLDFEKHVSIEAVNSTLSWRTERTNLKGNYHAKDIVVPKETFIVESDTYLCTFVSGSASVIQLDF